MKRIVFILCAFMCALLIAFNPTATAAAKEGFALWRDAVLPALLPFFICASIMRETGLLNARGIIPMFLLAFISGAPSGARLCASFDAYPPTQRTFLAAALNTISPMFICGAFAAAMMNMPAIAWPILISQLAVSAIFTFIIVKRCNPPHSTVTQPAESTPANLLVRGVSDSMVSLLSICGTIVFFMVIIRLLEHIRIMDIIALPLRALCSLLRLNEEIADVLLTGTLEITAGSSKLAQAGINARITCGAGAYLFSFGGLCVMAQSAMFMRIEIKRYLGLKFIQGLLAGALAYLIFPLFVRGDIAASASFDADAFLINAVSASGIFAVSLLGVGTILLITAIMRKLE